MPTRSRSSGGSRISRSWGIGPRRGVDSRGCYISTILYVKTKESGSLGACTGHTPWIRKWGHTTILKVTSFVLHHMEQNMIHTYATNGIYTRTKRAPTHSFVKPMEFNLLENRPSQFCK